MHAMEEGKRNRPYKDTEGYWTIGIGHLMEDQSPSNKDFSISDQRVHELYEIDLQNKINDLDRALPWAKELDPVRYMCLLDMCFQMGIGSAEKGTGLLGFKNTLRFIQNGDYEQAAKNMLLSKWARQTPNRAKRRADEMRTGIAYNYKQL